MILDSVVEVVLVGDLPCPRGAALPSAADRVLVPALAALPGVVATAAQAPAQAVELFHFIITNCTLHNWHWLFVTVKDFVSISPTAINLCFTVELRFACLRVK